VNYESSTLEPTKLGYPVLQGLALVLFIPFAFCAASIAFGVHDYWLGALVPLCVCACIMLTLYCFNTRARSSWGSMLILYRDLALYMGLVLINYLGFYAVGFARGVEEVWMTQKVYTLTLWTPGFLPFLLAVIFIAPITEELFYRGLVLSVFRRDTSRSWCVISIVASSALFMLSHTQYVYYQTYIYLFVLGVLLSFARLRTGSLSVPIIMHSFAGLLGYAIH